MTPDDDVISRRAAIAKVNAAKITVRAVASQLRGVELQRVVLDVLDLISEYLAAAPVVPSDCDHIIQLGFHGAIQCTPEQCPWCHPELQQKTVASPVTQWTREKIETELEMFRLALVDCIAHPAERYDEPYDIEGYRAGAKMAYSGALNALIGLRGALLLAQGEGL